MGGGREGSIVSELLTQVGCVSCCPNGSSKEASSGWYIQLVGVWATLSLCYRDCSSAQVGTVSGACPAGVRGKKGGGMATMKLYQSRKDLLCYCIINVHVPPQNAHTPIKNIYGTRHKEVKVLHLWQKVERRICSTPV